MRQAVMKRPLTRSVEISGFRFVEARNRLVQAREKRAVAWRQWHGGRALCDQESLAAELR